MKKILFIKANPVDTADLRLENEENSIRGALERSNDRANFSFETRGAVSKEALLDYLLTLKPNILHISGHGGSNEKLFFEASDGYKDEIAIEKLSGFLSNFTDHIECLFLNACHSLANIDNFGKDIPYIIGMKEEIPNDTAVNFSTSFYNSIFNGKSIDDSYKVALGMISLTGFNDELIPRFIYNAPKNGPAPNSENQTNTDADNAANNELKLKLVSKEEIELVKKQKKKKVRFYYGMTGLFCLLAIGWIAFSLYEGKPLEATLASLIPMVSGSFPIVEINKNKNRLDLLNLFELKLERLKKAISNLTSSDVESLNAEFLQYIKT